MLNSIHGSDRYCRQNVLLLAFMCLYISNLWAPPQQALLPTKNSDMILLSKLQSKTPAILHLEAITEVMQAPLAPHEIWI